MIITRLEQVAELKSTTVTSGYGILTIPMHLVTHPRGGVQMIRIPLFLVKIANFSSLTHHMIVNNHVNEYVVRYRTRFGCHDQ